MRRRTKVLMMVFLLIGSLITARMGFWASENISPDAQLDQHLIGALAGVAILSIAIIFVMLVAFEYREWMEYLGLYAAAVFAASLTLQAVIGLCMAWVMSSWDLACVCLIPLCASGIIAIILREQRK